MLLGGHHKIFGIIRWPSHEPTPLGVEVSQVSVTVDALMNPVFELFDTRHQIIGIGPSFLASMRRLDVGAIF